MMRAGKLMEKNGQLAFLETGGTPLSTEQQDEYINKLSGHTTDWFDLLFLSLIHIYRLNPILMTALTSALALIPLAVGGDLPGNEIQSPMAQVILGGLLSSTLLNGFVVPIMYILLNHKQKKVENLEA